MRRVGAVITTLAAVSLLGGCGGGSGAQGDAGPAAPSPTSYVAGALSECFIPRTSASVRPAQLTGQGMRLPGIVFRPAESGSRTAVVLLHQTDGNGKCGWSLFGNAVAAAGMDAIAFDQCGYGAAECTVRDPDDPLPQVRLALAYAHAELGAERVVLIGASMGGNRTVRAVAGGADVDAWADISGPSDYDDVALAPLAAKVSRPGLVALAADTDGADEAALAESLADATGATWIPAEGGHGYQLLTDDDGRLRPVGKQVLALAKG